MANPPPPPHARSASVHSRIIALAVAPSLVVIATGLGVGWYLAEGAVQQRAAAAFVVRKIDASEELWSALHDEQRAGALGLTGELATARSRMDTAAQEVLALSGEPAASGTDGMRASFENLLETATGVAAAREQVDAGLTGLAAFEAYEGIVDRSNAGLGGNLVDGGDADTGAALDASATLLRVAALVRASSTVAATSSGSTLDAASYPAFATEVAGLEESLDAAVPGLDDASRAAVEAVVASPRWADLSRDMAALLAAGPALDDPPRSVEPVVVPPGYEAAASAVAAALTDIAADGSRRAAAEQADRAATTLASIVTAALAAVAAAVLTLAVAFRIGTRLVRRLTRLRTDTLAISGTLPETLERLRRGEEVPIRTAFVGSDHGTDEIGQIAEAVDVAQRAAMAAAAEEARTLAGANAVFLNIAHRSQAIVHRQLQVLDEAERAEHNSDQLARLYHLDHLTTRERRNAENLIIMGGQQPRRRWRRPVALVELLRSAVSESEQYTRITLGDVPDVLIDGVAVGDLIHLVAELVDNATSFSPPQCAIDVRATVVGRGVVLEVQDRGLGIEDEPRERLNAMLAAPPDFGLMTLSEDSRLGMFVVARLAHLHGVRVTLTESAYGGVQVVVLVPNALVADPHDPTAELTGPESDAPAPLPAPRPAPAATRRTTAAPAIPQLPDRAAATPAAQGQDPTAEGSAGDDPSPAPPRLPERRPQANLAGPLKDDPDGSPSADLDRGDPDDRPPQRSGSAMSAMQRGSRSGRNGSTPDGGAR